MGLPLLFALYLAKLRVLLIKVAHRHFGSRRHCEANTSRFFTCTLTVPSLVM